MSIDNEGIVILRVSSADINEDVKSTTIKVNSRRFLLRVGRMRAALATHKKKETVEKTKQLT